MVDNMRTSTLDTTPRACQVSFTPPWCIRFLQCMLLFDHDGGAVAGSHPEDWLLGFSFEGRRGLEMPRTTTALVWREPNRGLFWGREIGQFMRGSSSLIAVRQQLVPSEQPSDDRSSQGNVCGSDHGRSDRLSNCAPGLRGRR